MARYLIIGASRGIGRAVAAHLAEHGHEILSVSRTPAHVGHWIKADVGTPDGVAHVVESVGDAALDGLLFLGGIWEKGAFVGAYDFLQSPVSEILQVIAVNLTAPILLAQGLTPVLSRSGAARIILIGSTTGLPNAATVEVANTASKFGLMGVAEALNLSLRPFRIATTVINPDNVETPEVLEDIETGAFSPQRPIPMTDLIGTVTYVLGLSSDSVPTVIDLRQTAPGES
ncbi:MAG: SDR family oxidoreductase [Pseudomonadota bacterium]